MRRHALGIAAMLLAASLTLVSSATGQHLDVLAFEEAGRVAVGEFNLEEFSAREERVFPARFDDFYAVNNPGFFSRAGDLPGSTDLEWDFLPMTVDTGIHTGHTSTLLYWDTLQHSTPEFGPTPAGHSLTLFGKDGASATADGGDQLVPGHTIETTAANGAIHEHRFFFLDDNGDGLTTTLPATGIYLLAMQLRMDGLDHSSPFFFVWATPESSVLPFIQPAAAWVDARVDTLVVDEVSLPGDFNFDGTVDAADYTVWRDGFGGEFGMAEYQLWRQNFGQSLAVLAGSATTIPEPTSLGVVTIVCALYFARRQRTSQTQHAA